MFHPSYLRPAKNVNATDTNRDMHLLILLIYITQTLTLLRSHSGGILQHEVAETDQKGLQPLLHGEQDMARDVST